MCICVCTYRCEWFTYICIPYKIGGGSEWFRHLKDGSVDMPTEFSSIALNKGEAVYEPGRRIRSFLGFFSCSYAVMEKGHLGIH